MFKTNKNSIKVAAVAACGLAAVLASGCGSSNQTPQVGLVDRQLVAMAHPAMADAQQTMKEEYSKVQNELMDSNSLPEAEKQAKVNEFRQRLADKEKEVLAPVQQSSDTAVNTVMQKDNMSVVLDKRAAVAGGKDITKEVLIQEGLSESDADAAIAKNAEQEKKLR